MGFQSSRIPFSTNSFEIDINSLYQKGKILRNPLESSWYCLWFFRWFIFSLAVFPALIWAKWYTTAELCLQVSFSRKNFTSLIVKIDFTTKIPWKFWFERPFLSLLWVALPAAQQPLGKICLGCQSKSKISHKDFKIIYPK